MVNYNLVIDTETNGLLNMYHRPFMIIVGKYDLNNPLNINIKIYLKNEYHLIQSLIDKANKLIFYNSKFDIHMLKQVGIEVHERDIKVEDAMVLWRLKIPALPPKNGGYKMGLKSAAAVCFNSSSKKEEEDLKKIKLAVRMFRRKELDNSLKTIDSSFLQLNKKIKYNEKLDKKEEIIYNLWLEKYPTIKGEKDLSANISYEDLWHENPDILNKYAKKDVELTHKLFLFLTENLTVNIIQKEAYERDIKTLKVLYFMERQPLYLDMAYIETKKKEMLSLIKRHEGAFKRMIKLPTYGIEAARSTPTMKKYLKELFPDIAISSLDQNNVKIFLDGNFPKHMKDILRKSTLIKKITKKYSTDLMSIYNKQIDGKYYTNFNITGTVTGRLSSDIQQLPKVGYIENGVEIFHPRKMFIAPPNYYWFFVDYSQMELKLAAIYSNLIDKPDINLLRMFIPYNINKGKWKKTDMHTLTALSAFPNIKEKDPDFKKYRNQAKGANFAMLYGAGVNKIKEMVKDPKSGNSLFKAFHNNFKAIKELNTWVKEYWFKNQYTLKNLYGRKYYIPPQSKRFLRKGLNYLIQGSGSDILKMVLIKCHDLLKNKKSHIIMNLHDEIQFYIHYDELNLITKIRDIMSLKNKYIVDLNVDIEYTDTNWQKIKQY